MSIQLFRPVHKIPSPFIYAPRSASGNSFNVITQSFGENLAPFYAQLGLKGHNGLDFIAPDGIEIYAAHDGEVFKTLDENNSSPTAGYGVYLKHKEGWWTLYFHLKDVKVKVGQIVKAGDLIAHSDNTGKYTLGSHLHFGLYPKDRDMGNGYEGAIDPIKYFSKEEITGIIINQKKMLKLLGENSTQKQFAIGDDKVAHRITLELLKELSLAGQIDPTNLAWIDNITEAGYTVGNDWGVII